MTHWSEALKSFDLTPAAMTWFASQPSYDVAWKTCSRGDWLFVLVSQATAIYEEGPWLKYIGLCSAYNDVFKGTPSKLEGARMAADLIRRRYSIPVVLKVREG